MLLPRTNIPLHCDFAITAPELIMPSCHQGVSRFPPSLSRFPSVCKPTPLSLCTSIRKSTHHTAEGFRAASFAYVHSTSSSATSFTYIHSPPSSVSFVRWTLCHRRLLLPCGRLSSKRPSIHPCSLEAVGMHFLLLCFSMLYDSQDSTLHSLSANVVSCHSTKYALHPLATCVPVLFLCFHC